MTRPKDNDVILALRLVQAALLTVQLTLCLRGLAQIAAKRKEAAK
jgi:hypothetical protein